MGYTYKVVTREVSADLETPISVFMKVCRGENSFLLESVEGGENVARYSFLGFDPLAIFTAKDGQVRVEYSGEVTEGPANPLASLRELMARFTFEPDASLQRFAGGAVGYLGYDMVRYVEELPIDTVDDLNLPDCYLVINRVVLVYDHVKQRLKIVVLVAEAEGLAGMARAEESIAEVLRRLDGPVLEEPVMEVNKPLQVSANMTREQYVDNVLQAKEYIAAGDIFQVVLSQRLQASLQVSPMNIYRRLRSLNPSPYMYYLNFTGVQVVGSSPEMLVRVQGGVVETRPIAGTKPRGVDATQDAELAAELLADEKERAEHLMLVDLGRNDIGRVSKYGTVEVERFMTVEYYSHVMHLVSAVRGQLNETQSADSALWACFPAGTLSGAPKIRAMEIIEELEPTRRGPYGGAVGYFSFNGNMDTCITIRTVVIKDGQAYVQAGAGIVADSVPETEYQESMNKAGAVLKVLGG